MNNYPTVSVIIPVFKAEKYLNRCLDSILAQSYTDFELILIDDGSPDHSGEICDEYAKKDTRVRVFHTKNSGPALSRNVGLENSNGRWVTFVDSDDWIELDAFQVLVDNAFDVDMVISGRIVDKLGKEISRELPTSGLFISDSKTSLWMDCIDSFCCRDYIWNRLYRMDIIKGNNLYFRDVRTGEDTIFNIEYHAFCKAIKIISYAYYHYQIIGDSISRGYQPDQLLSLQLQKRGYDNLASKDIVIDSRFQNDMERFQLQNCGFLFISNLLCIDSKLTFGDRYKILKREIWNNHSFMNLLKKRPECCVSFNQKIQRFLILYTNILALIIYNPIISILKKNKSL